MTSFKKSLSMIKPISHFLAVVSNQSVTHAGEALGIAPSRISESLKYLEEIWNVQLFHRESRQMKLTNAGQRAYERYHHLVYTLLDTVSEDIDPDAIPSVLSITTPVDIGTHLMPSVISSFNKQYPNVEVKLFASDQVMDMSEADIDLAIRVGKLQGQAESHEDVIMKTRPFLAASPEIIQNIHDGMYPEGAPFIRLLRLPETKEMKLRSTDTMLKLKSVAAADNAIAAQQMAYDGLGATLFTGLPTKPYLEKGRLEKIDHVVMPDIYIFASWPGRRLTQGAKALLDLFKKELKRQQLDG
ncbi:LysR family transcriptional regulator [Grimontia indica]|nr:LysR family transcriptional regulator [Grimontia indica]